MPISNFPSTRNPKLEFPTWLNQLIAEAYSLGLKGYVLTQAQFEISLGQAVGDVFQPLVKPIMPAQNASQNAWSRYRDGVQEYNEEMRRYIDLRGRFISALSADISALVGDEDTGTLNKTLLQMITTMRNHFETWTQSELTAIKNTLHDGSISIKIEEPIETYLQKIKVIHAVAARNLSTIPDADKITFVCKELRKLNIMQLNLWIMTYENQNPEMAQKVFVNFTAALRITYQALDKDTMQSAGYTAAQLQVKDEFQEQLTAITAQMNDLKKTQKAGGEGERKRKQTQRDEKDTGEPKPFKFCDTCNFNKSHWSKACNRPKDGHNFKKNQPERN